MIRSANTRTRLPVGIGVSLGTLLIIRRRNGRTLLPD